MRIPAETVVRVREVAASVGMGPTEWMRAAVEERLARRATKKPRRPEPAG